MSSPFAITAAANTVPLDANCQGQASFTVSNTTVRATRGHASIVAQPATAGSWLMLQGEAEREFAGVGSQHYSVSITVPPGAAPGDYLFRLDMTDIANPDDNFSEGPTIKFVVPAPVVVKKPFPWWTVAVVVGALIICGGSIYGIVRASHTTYSKKTPPPTPTPTPRPAFAAGSWQGQFSNVAPTQSPQTLNLTTVQQTTFGGQLVYVCPGSGEGFKANELMVTGTAGGLKQFGSAAQNRLQEVIAQYGTGTQTYVEFTDTSYISSCGLGAPDFAIHTVFDAVVFPDGSLHGIWFNPGDATPAGSFTLNKM